MGTRRGAAVLIVGLILIAAASGRAEKRKVYIREFPPKLGAKARHTRLDCSHYVHEVYQRAHRPYHYASSEELYGGVDEFARVQSPMPGDLIVWRGHVGIITDPNANQFVSVLRSGVKTDDYRSSYWRSRGRPHFFRYVGEHTAGDSTRLPYFSTYDDSD